MSNLKVIVSKFGGSSMKDAEAITRSAKIAASRNSSVVVVSATYGTTNALIELSEKAKQGMGEDVATIIEAIKDNHHKIARDLEADEATFNHLTTLLEELETLAKGMTFLKDAPPKAMDRLLSLGERLSSPLMTSALGQVHQRDYQGKKTENFDARKVIRTDDTFGKGAAQIEEIKALGGKQLYPAKYGELTYVTQGFIGSTAEGETTTLGRGGSDYSAALFAEAIGADLLEIWTDVAGIATTDPRICPQARPINEITFQEAAELAVFGAKILHPTTLAPVQRAGIPCFVGSSYEPEAPGTWIKDHCEDQPLIRAMAIKKNQVLLTLTTPKMLDTYGYLSRVFGIFEKYKISVDAITTSEISLAMTVEKETLSKKGFLEDLRSLGSVEIEEDLALVSLIGNNINHTAGLAHSIFTGLANTDNPINVRMICLGASKHNFCFVVKDEQASQAIIQLHGEFIEGNHSL